MPKSWSESSVVTCTRCLERKRHPKHPSWCAVCLSEYNASIRKGMLPNERHLTLLQGSGGSY
jgi:hypothetical protein